MAGQNLITSSADLTQADIIILAQAVQRLETASIAARIGHLIGMPIEKALAALPGHWSTIVSRVTQTALEKAMDAALFSLQTRPVSPSNRLHKMSAGFSGALSGTFGIGALAVELPVSATLMLRSIADIARSHVKICKIWIPAWLV